MADLLLVPGADGRAWSWHRLVPELAARGPGGHLPPLADPVGLAEALDAIVRRPRAAEAGR